MHDILEDLTGSSIVNAIETNLHQAWVRLAHGLGAMIHDEPEMLWFYSGLPFQLANGIVRTSFESDKADEVLDERLEQLAAQQVPMAWLIGPSTSPANLGSYLLKHGWMQDDEAPGMAVELRTLGERLAPPPHLTIEHVKDIETLKTWLRVMTVGSDIPEEGLTQLLDMATQRGYRDDGILSYYLGTLDNKPVATSLLFLGGGVAGIYNVATLPEFRSRGIGTALTLAPLLDARASGYKMGTLQSSPMGLNLYRRLGFQEYCRFQAYFWNRKDNTADSTALNRIG